MSYVMNFSELETDEMLPEMVFGPITNLQLVKWAAGSGDFNPIHFDLNVAQKQGLENVLIHGPFKMACVCRMFQSYAGPQGHIRKINALYTGLDISGNSLTCRAKIIKKFENEGEKQVECAYEMVNHENKITVKGEALVVLG